MLEIKQIFSRKEERPAESSKIVYPPRLQLKCDDKNIDCDEIDRQFYGRILDVVGFVDSGNNDTEVKVLQDMKEILLDQKRLISMFPRVPMVLPRLLKAIRSDQSTAQSIAGLIREDVVLVADVMRLLESPLYQSRNKITSLEHAIVMLGRDGINRLVALAVMKPLIHTKGGYFLQSSSQLLWQHAEMTANAAYQLVATDEEARFHIYLAGLLHNLGFTVGLKILDEQEIAKDVLGSREFCKEFVRYCRTINRHIAELWSMPAAVTRAFQVQENTEAHNADEFDVSLYVADHLVKARLLTDRLDIESGNTHVLLNEQPSPACEDLFNTLIEAAEV